MTLHFVGHGRVIAYIVPYIDLNSHKMHSIGNGNVENMQFVGIFTIEDVSLWALFGAELMMRDGSGWAILIIVCSFRVRSASFYRG